MIMQFRITFILGIVLNQFCSGIKRKDVLAMKAFATCEGHISPNGYFNTSIVHLGKGVTVLNADILIREPAKEVVGYFILMKCSTIVRKNCEEILRFYQADLCEKYVEKGQYWTSFFEHITPPHKCPMVLNTHHHLRNATLDVNGVLPYLKRFPGTYSTFWLFRHEVFRKKDKLELDCLEFLFKVDKIVVKD